LEAGKNIKEKYREQTGRCPVDFLYKAIDLCNTCDIGYKSSKNQRLHIELTLIRLGNLTDEKKNDEQQVKTEIKLHADKPVSFPVKNSAEKNQVSEQTQATVNHNNDKPDNPAKDSVSEVKEEVKPLKKAYISKTPSIREALGNFGGAKISNEVSDDESNEDILEEDAVQNTPFTIEDLLKKWSEFVESIKEEMPRMYSTLKNQQPGISGTGLLDLELKNNAQADDFRTKVKPALMNFLREELHNDLIELEEKITEDKGNGSKKLYTAEEKYKHMSQKNPTLEQLKQDFNLDFE
jgi:DNA polymerase-3 subunit gamma/tau